jgi:hypothetical protein
LAVTPGEITSSDALLRGWEDGDLSRGDVYGVLLRCVTPETVDAWIAALPDDLRPDVLRWMSGLLDGRGAPDVPLRGLDLPESPDARAALRSWLLGHGVSRADDVLIKPLAAAPRAIPSGPIAGWSTAA